MQSSTPISVDWEARLPLQRPRLVRYCLRRTGNRDAAEDLAQETLYEAWRHLHKVHDPDGLERWLFAIAGNVCLRWARQRGHQLAHHEQQFPDGEESAPPWEETVAADVDLDVELERTELVELLDRALALLPPDTRQALVQRYVEDTPQAEIARRLGATEGAIEARVQRGKLALRQVLTNRFPEDAVVYGLIPATGDAMQATRLWCPGCGRHRLEGYLRPEQGELRLRCPGCWQAPTENWHYMNANVGNALRGVRTYKPAVSRCLGIIHDLFQGQAADGTVRCPSCQTRLPIRRHVVWPGANIPWHRSESLRLSCPTCSTVEDHESWHSLAWCLPDVRRFWREHPRMRFLPGREIEVNGSRAAVTGFESLTDGARIEVVSLRETGKALSVNGMPPRRDVERP